MHHNWKDLITLRSNGVGQYPDGLYLGNIRQAKDVHGVCLKRKGVERRKGVGRLVFSANICHNSRFIRRRGLCSWTTIDIKSKVQGGKSLTKFIFDLQMEAGNTKHIMLQQKLGQKANSKTVTTGHFWFWLLPMWIVEQNADEQFLNTRILHRITGPRAQAGFLTRISCVLQENTPEWLPNPLASSPTVLPFSVSQTHMTPPGADSALQASRKGATCLPFFG